MTNLVVLFRAPLLQLGTGSETTRYLMENLPINLGLAIRQQIRYIYHLNFLTQESLYIPFLFSKNSQRLAAYLFLYDLVVVVVAKQKSNCIFFPY